MSTFVVRYSKSVKVVLDLCPNFENTSRTYESVPNNGLLAQQIYRL